MGGRGSSDSSREGTPRPALAWRLGEGPRLGSGPLAALDTLARSGLPVLEGVVLSREAHEEYLRETGLALALRSCDPAGEALGQALLLRQAYVSAPVGRVIHELITETLIGLEAFSVRVLSEDGAWQDLRAIPEVRDAVREAWLHPAGLKRQVRAAATGPPPTWPVLMQREARPDHVGWTLAGDESPGALYDVRPARDDLPPGRGLADLSVEAGAALDGPARLRWGLEGGEWYVLGVEPE